MPANIGTADRIVRFIVGVLLIAFALSIGFPKTSWSWVGWIGVIPLLTAVFGYCPGYKLLGLSTCPLTRKAG